MSHSPALASRTAAAPDDRHRAIAIWLWLCAAMVFAMVLIGGITRLTESGLSIMEWMPVTGILPPLSEAEWQRLFDIYKQIPEYQQINRGMTLDEFRSIFWWEWAHRLWGRLIGFVFLLPFLWFLLRRRIPDGLTPHLVAAFVLGGAQGALGWFMVASGFADRTDVSQYRLAAHLALALSIYLYLLWLALTCTRSSVARIRPAQRPRLVLLLVCIAITATMGAFTAGMDGGLVYNEFPLMGGSFLPADALALAPVWINPFENPVAAQFLHRWLAIATAALILLTWWRAPRQDRGISRGRPFDLLAAMAIAQVGLGIATLLSIVWLPVAVLHQAGAVILLSLALWSIYEARPARPAVMS